MTVSSKDIDFGEIFQDRSNRILAQLTKEAWLDGYCSAAIVVGLDTAHPTRKAIINRFWRRLKQETNNA